MSGPGARLDTEDVHVLICEFGYAITEQDIDRLTSTSSTDRLLPRHRLWLDKDVAGSRRPYPSRTSARWRCGFRVPGERSAAVVTHDGTGGLPRRG
ncbi:hypothetical protein GCM10023175_52850 [Pseudonocardia xishanensis]|uniref:Uncharacterized protein n=2 Tax=Pseudonocardia xishanensis TaxID=630995 RepID=A0ABP8S0T0_9PSEU